MPESFVCASKKYSSRQIIVEFVFLLAAILAGMYYRVLTAAAHRKTFSGTKTVIESRIKLECEREQQEQLLLSVIPAYIAAEVSDNVVSRIIMHGVNLHDLIKILITTSRSTLAINFSRIRAHMHVYTEYPMTQPP